VLPTAANKYESLCSVSRLFVYVLVRLALWWLKFRSDLVLFVVYNNGLNPNYLLEQDCFKGTKLMDVLRYTALLNSVRKTVCGGDCEACVCATFASWYINMCILTSCVI
jgi:hypothetical protein